MQKDSKIPSSPIKPVQATFQPRRRRIYDFNLTYLFLFLFYLACFERGRGNGRKGRRNLEVRALRRFGQGQVGSRQVGSTTELLLSSGTLGIFDLGDIVE
uniref:Uncharacterized protein n=1 Tax=Bursaphelenchus xylophilus TaxID=6326 RepID=A0A1I7SJM1_BURXY